VLETVFCDLELNYNITFLIVMFLVFGSMCWNCVIYLVIHTYLVFYTYIG
jgi:hypothetical protein